MGWKQLQDGSLRIDGQRFDNPRDSFERAVNAYLEQNDGERPPSEEISLQFGWPLSTRIGEPRPFSDAACRNHLDWICNAHTRALAVENGNTPAELDIIAGNVLRWAGYFGIPITDAERNIAKRLGIEVPTCPKLEDDRLRHRRLGF